MNRVLLLCACLLSIGMFLPATQARPDLEGAVFVDDSGAYSADFAWSGSCNGDVVLTLTIHRPGGDDVRSVGATSVMVPDACFTPTCFECPPVPLPFAWEINGDGVGLVGAGSSYYYTYQNWEAAWSLQGPWDEGHVEARGTLL